MGIYDEKRTAKDLLRRREFKARRELWIRCDESFLHIQNQKSISSTEGSTTLLSVIYSTTRTIYVLHLVRPLFWWPRLFPSLLDISLTNLPVGILSPAMPSIPSLVINLWLASYVSRCVPPFEWRVKANIFNQLFRQRYNISPNDPYDPNDFCYSIGIGLLKTASS